MKVCSKDVPLVSKNTMKTVYYAAIINVFNKRKTRYRKLLKLIKVKARTADTQPINLEKIKSESVVFDLIH